jgi:hypothetical protein
MLAALREDSPGVELTRGVLHGAELVPKPRYDRIPIVRDIGVNHVVLNLKYGRRPAAEMLDDLAQTIVLLFLVHRLDAG